MGADYNGMYNLDSQRETGLGEEKELRKGIFSKVLISLIVAANLVFVAVVLYIFCTTYAEPSTLIMAWFGFSTGELWALAFVKKSKLKSGAEAPLPPDGPGFAGHPKKEEQDHGSERKFDWEEESSEPNTAFSTTPEGFSTGPHREPEADPAPQQDAGGIRL